MYHYILQGIFSRKSNHRSMVLIHITTLVLPTTELSINQPITQYVRQIIFFNPNPNSNPPLF